jgi:hypothetical protein
MSNRVLITEEPYTDRAGKSSSGETQRKGVWPAKWITVEGDSEPPYVCAFRNSFKLDSTLTVRLHVTADQRYDLYLDGEFIGRGSERGDANHWFFETYELNLAAGEHTLVARTWFMPPTSRLAPYAQHSVHAGFLLAPEDESLLDVLATGVAPWEAKILGGYEFTDPSMAWGTGANVVIHGEQFAWGFERGEGDNWQPVRTLNPGVSASTANETQSEHLLMPATLSAQLNELRHIGRVVLVAEVESNATSQIPIRQSDDIVADRQAWQSLLSGQGSVTVPANTRRRVLVDLEDYYCAYPEVTTTGGAGATVRVHWQESLFTHGKDDQDKGNRDETEGKYFRQIWMCDEGIGDTFLPDGGAQRFFSTLWWQCGRYVEILVETKDEVLTLDAFALRETRYPLELESTLKAVTSA